MFTSLTYEERLALVGLIKWLTLSDLETTPGELALIDKVVKELGEGEYHRLFNEVDSRFKGFEEFSAFVTATGSTAARRLIYDFMLEYAEADALDVNEGRDLAWLARIWSLD